MLGLTEQTKVTRLLALMANIFRSMFFKVLRLLPKSKKMLPSGLPDLVGDNESLARFLTSSRQFNSTAVKPSAFIPDANYETSVFRHSSEPRDPLWTIGVVAANTRNLHGAGIIRAAVVRLAELKVEAVEPPDKHAVIVGWPRNKDDQDMQDAAHLELATTLAKNALLIKK